MLERYHRFLQQVYSIIITKISDIKPELVFQMFFQAMNNLVGPNRLVFALLVFGTYPKINKLDAPSASIIQRAIVMKKTMNEIRKYIVS